MYVRLFGPPSMSFRGDPVAFSFKKVEALAYILVTEGGVSRTWLAQHLWPEKDERSGAKNLRNALYQLRSTMAQSVVLSNNSRISLAPGMVRSDLDFLSDLDVLGERDLRRLGLPFLEGFSLEGSEEFNHWVQQKREFFRELYLRNLRAAADRAALSGEDRRAVALLNNGLSVAPWDEEIAQRLMEALAKQGNLPRIVETYATLSDRLKREMGIDPSPETTDLYRSIFQRLDSVSIRTAKDPSEDLWGRDNEKAQILELIADHDHRPLCISLWGPEGSGRTAILNRILRDHSDILGRSVVCRISHQNRSDPWQDLYQTTERYGLKLDQSPSFAQQGKDLARAIAKRPHEARITLFLDEMRFLGDGEKELLETFLASAGEGVTVIMVDHPETFGSNDRWLGAMATEGRIKYRSIGIFPFGPRQCGLFCRHMLGMAEESPLPDQDEAIYRETLGLPVCLAALVDLYSQGKGLEDLNSKLEHAIRAMSSRLSSVQLEILETMAIVDEPISADVLKGHLNGDIEAELVKLERMDLIRLDLSSDGTSALTVGHPQIKTFFRRFASKLKRQFISSKMLSRSLQERGQDFIPPDRCLRDLERSKEGGSVEQMIEAHLRYLKLLVRANCEGFPPIQDWILRRTEQLNHGWEKEIYRTTESIRALLRRGTTDRGAQESAENRFQALRGFYELWSGDIQKSKRYLEKALRFAMDRDHSLAAESLHGLCLMALRTGDEDLLERFSEDMETVSEGNQVNQSIALRMKGVALARKGQTLEGKRCLALALEILEDLKNLGYSYSSLLAMVESSLGRLDLDRGDFEQGEFYVKKALSELKKGEIRQGQWIMHLYIAQAMWMRGDLAGVSENLSKVREDKEDIMFGDLGVIFNSLSAHLAHCEGDGDNTDLFIKRARFATTWLVRKDSSMDLLGSVERKIEGI